MEKLDGRASREYTFLSPHLNLPFRRKFWRNVKKGKFCWEWAGAHSKAGYGQIRYLNILWYSHRLVWVMKKRPLMLGDFILHRCDNPKCVRPSHLRIGTQTDNMRDAILKGRFSMPPHKFGIEHHNSKMTPNKVIELRRLFSQGWTFRALGRKYGLDKTTAASIARRETWVAVA